MSKPLVLAYATNRALRTITKEDAMRLTHVNLAFGVIRKGLLDMSHLPDIGYIETIRGMNPGIKFVLSVGGWGAGGFSDMCVTEEGRRAFASSVRAALDKFNLDGVDIDWEYPCSGAAEIDFRPEDRENFTHLLQALRDAVGNRIVSIAAGAGQYFIDGTEMDKVAAICDYVQLMTYDMRSGFCRQAGHHTSLYPAAGDKDEIGGKNVVDMFVNAGVPKSKIIFGAAFYARHWDKVPDVNHGLLQPAGTVGQGGPNYGEIVKNYIGKDGWTEYWDDTAKAPYLYKDGTFVSYDNPRSLKCKCEYLVQEGLLGIMYWEHGCDDTHTLLKAIADAL